MIKNLTSTLLVGTALALAPLALAADEWTPLFDGKSLDGWVVKSGFAKYVVEDGAIVGTTETGSPNTFLTSAKEYGDFELEFEVKVDVELNSGVQIRSTLKDVDKDKYGGRINGPQCEIMVSPGASGYIYGEATSLGWLSQEPKDKKTHDFMKNGEWNKFRIVAKGPRIQTWINGNPVADLTHEEIYKTHPKGVIGLQVHGIAKDKGPFQVRWRNLKIKELK